MASIQRIGLFVGSFNPWHKGHEDILKKALPLFDKIYVMQWHDSSKLVHVDKSFMIEASSLDEEKIECGIYQGLTKDVAEVVHATAIIRGLRNGQDLEYERDVQYTNEDLGLTIPTVYFLCDRQFIATRSSIIRKLK